MMITTAQSGVGSAVIWAGVMVLALLAGTVVLYLLRRRLFSRDDSAADSGLTLHDLRTMRGRGDISEEEFEAAKKIVLAGSADGAAPGRNPITGSPRSKNGV